MRSTPLEIAVGRGGIFEVVALTGGYLHDSC